MKRMMLMILMILSVGISQAVVVNVDVDASGVVTYSGQGAYSDPGNNYWNSLTGTSLTNLIASDGVTETGISITTSNGSRNDKTADIPGDGDAGDLMGDYSYSRNAGQTATVSGLTPGSPYLVYVYCQGDANNQYATVTIGDTSVTTTGLYSSVLTEGANYVAIEATADENGEILVSLMYVVRYTGFNGIQIADAVTRGAAHSPVPTGDAVDSTEVSSVSWYSPEQDAEGVVIGDPNIISVDGYDVYWSTDPNYATDLPVSVQQQAQSYTPAEITFETTYFWRVDTYVTWDSNEITGNFTDVIEGREWQFTTLPDYLPPVLSLDNVLTTLDLTPAALAAEITENSTDIVSVTFELMTDDVEFPAGSDAVLTDTTSDNQMPTAELMTTTPGTYKVKLVITDEGNLPAQEPTTLEVIAKVEVSDDPCQAAKDAGGWSANEFDFDGNCLVDLLDFVEVAAQWLNSTEMDAQEIYTGVADYVPQNAFDIRIEAEWIDPNDPNACSDGPISNNTGIRIENQANASGGQALGYANDTAWVEYTIDVPVSAVGVAVDVYAAHALSGTGTVTLSFGTGEEGQADIYGTATLPGTSGWTNFISGMKIGEVTFTTAGPQIVRTSYGGGLNLDWFSFDF